MKDDGLPEMIFKTGFEPVGRHRISNYFNLKILENIKPALSGDIKSGWLNHSLGG